MIFPDLKFAVGKENMVVADVDDTLVVAVLIVKVVLIEIAPLTDKISFVLSHVRLVSPFDKPLSLKMI